MRVAQACYLCAGELFVRNTIPFLAVVLLFLGTSAFAQMVSGNSSGSNASSSFQSGSDFIENNGLSVRVLFVSKASGEQRTVSIELKNSREEPIWLAIIGPPPTAVDTSGNTYSVVQIAGLATCEQLVTKHIASCMTNRYGYMPGDSLSNLAPGASSLVNMTIQAASGQAVDEGFLSLTMNAALGIGDQPKGDGDRGLISIPVSFPLISLEAQ